MVLTSAQDDMLTCCSEDITLRHAPGLTMLDRLQEVSQGKTDSQLMRAEAITLVSALRLRMLHRLQEVLRPRGTDVCRAEAAGVCVPQERAGPAGAGPEEAEAEVHPHRWHYTRCCTSEGCGQVPIAEEHGHCPPGHPGRQCEPPGIVYVLSLLENELQRQTGGNLAGCLGF